MKRYFRYLITLLLFIFMTPAAAYSQSSIEKIVETLENDSNCKTIIYREKRSHDTRKVVSMELIVTFTDNDLAKRLINAFKKERQHSISYSVDNSDGRIKDSIYKIEFYSKDKMWSSYTLIHSGNTKNKRDPEKWTLSVKRDVSPNVKSNNKRRTKRTSTRRRTTTPTYYIETVTVSEI